MHLGDCSGQSSIYEDEDAEEKSLAVYAVFRSFELQTEDRAGLQLFCLGTPGQSLERRNSGLRPCGVAVG